MATTVLPVPAEPVTFAGPLNTLATSAFPTVEHGKVDLGLAPRRALHRTIAGVRDDYTNLRNNTAAAKLIEYTNHLTKEGVTARAAQHTRQVWAALGGHLGKPAYCVAVHTSVRRMLPAVVARTIVVCSSYQGMGS